MTMKTNTLVLIFVISIVLLILIGSTFATPIKSFFGSIGEILTGENQTGSQEGHDVEYLEEGPTETPLEENPYKYKPIVNITLETPITESISEVSGTPYSYTELRSITEIVLPYVTISDSDLDKIFKWLAQKTKTFTGEKYIDFKPRLTHSGATLLFTGEGYVDFENIGDYLKADNYFITFNISDGKLICMEECKVVRYGVAEESREIAENIVAEKEPEIPEKVGLYSVTWFPDKPNLINLDYCACMLPAVGLPHALASVDLISKEIISISKNW